MIFDPIPLLPAFVRFAAALVPDEPGLESHRPINRAPYRPPIGAVAELPRGTVHGEHAIVCYQANSRVLRFLQSLFEFIQYHCSLPQPGEPCRGRIHRDVRDSKSLMTASSLEQCSETAAVGVKPTNKGIGPFHPNALKLSSSSREYFSFPQMKLTTIGRSRNARARRRCPRSPAGCFGKFRGTIFAEIDIISRRVAITTTGP